MLYVVISWMWIGLSAFCAGYTVTHLLNKATGFAKKDPDTVLMLGICFLTVYAQVFSLLYKVGVLASVILLCMIAVSLLFLWKGILRYVREVLAALWKGKWLFFLLTGLP